MQFLACFYLLIFKVKEDSLSDVIFLASQGVSFTEVQEGLVGRRGVSALRIFDVLLQPRGTDLGTLVVLFHQQLPWVLDISPKHVDFHFRDID